MPALPLDALVEELAIVAGRVERESTLRLDGIIADLRRIDAERELRFVALERSIIDRLGLIKDGAPGRDGIDGERGLTGEKGERGEAGAPGDRGERGEKGEPGLPGASGERGLIGERGEAGAPGDRGERGEKGEPGLPGERGFSLSDFDTELVDEGRTLLLKFGSGDTQEIHEIALAVGPAGPKGDQGDPGLPGVRGEIGERGAPGAPGVLPSVEIWTDCVHYEGQVRSHHGSTYQALRDTAKEPPHDDWRCIAAAGRDGQDGRSFVIRGTFDAQISDYHELDVVVLNGASFAARRDNPGACPGDGWQLMASQGKRGQPGERGLPGPKGDRGVAGAPVVSVDVNGDAVLSLYNGDGSHVDCDLYPLMSKLQQR